MKKVALVAVLFLGTNFTFGQEKVSQATIESVSEAELYRSVKPKDGAPAVFANQEELNSKKVDKIEKIKLLILENRTNASMVNGLKEELWRFENAIVKSKN